MNEIKYCRKCGDELIDENWAISSIKKCDYICKKCAIKKSKDWVIDNREKTREYKRHYQRKSRGGKSMSENKSCASYLGVYIAEEVLYNVFKNVIKMPCNNPGFDFICGRGYKIDVKSACRHSYDDRSDNWQFRINYNKIPDYFLCLAFDNRDNLNPEYIWLIPSSHINYKSGITISESTIQKYNDYKIDKINDIITCCNIMKNKEEYKLH